MPTFEITELIKGRPKKITSSKERECYDILDELHIDYERVEYNYYPENLKEQLLIDKKIDVTGIKNLVFRTKNKKHFFFIILPRDKIFDEKAFRLKYGVPRINLATENNLNEILRTHKGAVSIMELAYDKDNLIAVYIDKTLITKKYFRFHPNENTATVRIKTEDLLNKLMPYLNHELIIMD